jgi:hypothetical protein
MKTSELTGAALDWAVAKCEFVGAPLINIVCGVLNTTESDNWQPSTDWAQGGPIIEREGISVICWSFHSMPWKASIEGGTDAGVDLYVEYGPTPLIAAMRCYVGSKLGNEVDVPEELK